MANEQISIVSGPKELMTQSTIGPVLELGTPEKFLSFFKQHVDRHCNLT